MIKILFICHGNICRSTMCESVFTYMIKKRDIADQFIVDSAASKEIEIAKSLGL